MKVNIHHINKEHPVFELEDVIYDLIHLSTGQALETIQRQTAFICAGMPNAIQAFRHC